MTTSYPTALDTLANPSATTLEDASGYEHDVQHATANDAIEALEAKVGITGSAVTSSLDYRVVDLEASVTTLENAVTGWGPETAPTYSNIPYWAVGANVAGLLTQRMTLTAIHLPPMTVTSISFMSGSTAANTPTNWWFALYDSSRNLLRQTADQTTTAWASQTMKTVALSSTYAISTAGWYYLGIMMKATTVVNLKGANTGDTDFLGALSPIPVGRAADTGLTTTAPNPAGALSASIAVIPWCGVA